MLRLRPLLSLFLFCSLTLVPCAFAQSTLTQIEDTVYNQDGSLFNGTLAVTWTGSAPSTASNPTPYNATVKIYTGALSIALIPSTTSPQSAPYTAVFTTSDGLKTWTQTWQVPPASSPLTISEINITSPTGTGPGTGLQISISQVTGLTASLSTITGSLNSLTTSNNSLSSQVAALSTAVANLTALVNGLGGGSPGNISTAFSDGEVPGGSVDGSNAAFVLANAPSPAMTLALYWNGVLMSNGADYNLSGSTVTFINGQMPQPGDILQAYYRYAGTSPAPVFVDNQAPQGTMDGTNLTFTLNSAPQPVMSLKLFKNGDLLQQNTDYTLNGTTITFANTVVAPQPGDSLVAFYRTRGN